MFVSFKKVFMIKQGLFVLTCVNFCDIYPKNMELSKKINRKRSFVASEEDAKQDAEERTRQKKRNRDEFDVLVALCKEMKDKNPTPEWRKNMLERSNVVNQGRGLCFWRIIPALIKEMPPYKEDSFGSYRNPVWSPFQAAHRRFKEQQKKEQESLRRYGVHLYIPLDMMSVDAYSNQDLSYEKPAPSENDKMLADLLEKFHISGDEDDCEDSGIDALTKDISNIAIASVNHGEDGEL